MGTFNALFDLPIHLILQIVNPNSDNLPDITPEKVDKVIIRFKPKLCCRINSVAIVHKKRICVDCFQELKEKYTGGQWEITGANS